MNVPVRTGYVLLICLFALLKTGAASADILPESFVQSGEFENSTFICPLGGEEFSQTTAYPHFPLEPFPDGSHLGDNFIDQQIAECPDNQLLLIPDFDSTGESADGSVAFQFYTSDQIARLPELLASPAWEELKGTTRQLRAYWLASELGMEPFTRLTLLMQSPYGAGDEAARRTANGAIVRDGPDLIGHARNFEEYRFLHFRITDALRQLGRFDEALAMFSSFDAAAAPEFPEDAEFDNDPEFAGDPAIANDDQKFGPSESEDNSYFPDEFVPGIVTAIAQRNSDRFAVAMLEGRVRSDTCREYLPAFHRFSPRIPVDCEPYRAEQVSYFKTAPRIDELIADAFESQEAPAPPVSADEIITSCANYSGDLAEGEELDYTLYDQCQQYRDALEEAMAELLSDDDDAFASLCETAPTLNMRGCRAANEIRTDRMASALLANREALAADCRAITLYDRPLELVRACYALETYNGAAYWEGYSPLIAELAELRALRTNDAQAAIKTIVENLDKQR